MPKHWSEYTPGERNFWETWTKIELLSASPNLEEANTAVLIANRRLDDKGYTRLDIPYRIKKYLRYMGVPTTLNGRDKRKIGRIYRQTSGDPLRNAGSVRFRVNFALDALGGKGTLKQIYSEYLKKFGHTPMNYEAMIRRELQDGRKQGVFKSSQRGVWEKSV